MALKIDLNNLNVKRQINQLAEICSYGIEWNRNTLEGDYSLGGIETTAHIISCCIVQWFGFEDCDTGEVRDFLKLETAAFGKRKITTEQWEKRITNYLKDNYNKY